MSNQILFVSLLPILEVLCRCALSDVSDAALHRLSTPSQEKLTFLMMQIEAGNAG